MTDDFLDKIRSDDLKHHGVKGQKWGVIRSRLSVGKKASSADSDSKKEDASSSATPAKKNGSSGGSSKPTQTETPQRKGESDRDRYNRLVAKAKKEGTTSLSQMEIAFIGARRESIAKANKMLTPAKKTDWIKESIQSSVKKAGQQQIQNITETLASKYIGDAFKNALSTKVPEKTFAQKVEEAASSSYNKEVFDKAVKTAIDYKRQQTNTNP